MPQGIEFLEMDKNGQQTLFGGGLDSHVFDNIISVENLLDAWREFVRGKKSKRDVQEFELGLIENILHLHKDLASKRYKHGSYQAFNISDPKPRNIHKASVRDRLLHHAIYRVLYPYFDKKFIHDSYSCRLNKGTHRAMNRFRSLSYKVSKNHTRTCWILKCDIRKFFASIDHQTLRYIIAKYISDEDVLWLLGQVIESFNPGLPLGNLTSQLLVNIYMNEFDQFVKHKLKIKYYIRYADDFTITSIYRSELENLLPKLEDFLKDKLKLEIHPSKVFIKTLASGVDFLGWVHFPDHRVIRTVTKRRMLKKLNCKNKRSYVGLIKHGNTHKLRALISSF
jgi:RNA-directed DNA polymerase